MLAYLTRGKVVSMFLLNVDSYLSSEGKVNLWTEDDAWDGSICF
jgi:hypothetical protein